MDMDRDSRLEEEPRTDPSRRPDAGDFDPALTPQAMETLLRGDDGRVAAATKRLSQARQQFELGTDRSRFRTDAGHAGALAEAEPVLRQAEREAVAVAEAAARNARQLLAQLTAAGQPTLAAAADAPAAAARAPFVKEDCADLSLGELVARVRAAVAAEHRPLMWLYARYGAPRVTAAAHHDDPPGAEAARRELGALLRAIRDRLGDRSADPVRERATAGLRSAQVLRAAASTRAQQREAEAAVARMIPNAVKIPE